MYNLPEDWGDYYQTCTQCMGRYHASGTVECYCKPCSKCGDLVYSENLAHQDGRCDDCYCDGLDDDDEDGE